MSGVFSTANTSIGEKAMVKVLKEGMAKYELDKNSIVTKYFKRFATTDKTTLTTSISTQEVMRPLAEDQTAPNVNIIQGYESKISWNRYGLSRAVSWEALKTDDFGVIEKMKDDIINTVKRTEEYYGTRILRQAFSSSYPLATGTPLITAQYPLRFGGTQANTFTDVQKALSYDSLHELMDIMIDMKTHSGELLNRGNKLTLVVGNRSAVRDIAFQLCGIDGATAKPGSEFNDSNFFQRYEGVEFNLILTNLTSFQIAKQLGETTGLSTDSANLRYSTQWMLIDEQMLMEGEYLMMPILNESNSLVRMIESESLSQKTNLYHFFGHGVASGFNGWIAGSTGTNLVTNF